MKSILILGTGNAQEDLIKLCKEKGLEVYACSYSQGEKAERYVDHFAQINIIDTNKIEEYVKKHQIDYIYSVGSDLAMPTVAKVAENRGMICPVSFNITFICNNKGALGGNFDGNLKYMILSDIPDKIRLEFPVVMKPVDSQGQRGVVTVYNMKELTELFEGTMSYSREKKVIIEEYVEGDEVSVNVFVKNGEIIFSLISDRIVWEEYPGGIIRKHELPSKYAGLEEENKINNLVKRVINKLEILNGPVYFQIKLKNGKEPKLLEVTPRLDGCHMWRAIKEYTGIDLLDACVKLLLEEKVCLQYSKPAFSSISLEFICAEPETEFDKNKYNTENTIFSKYYYKNNEKVKKMNGYMEKCGYVIQGDK